MEELIKINYEDIIFKDLWEWCWGEYTELMTG